MQRHENDENIKSVVYPIGDVNEVIDSSPFLSFSDQFGDICQWTTTHSSEPYDRYSSDSKVLNQGQETLSFYSYESVDKKAVHHSHNQRSSQSWDETFLHNLAQWVDDVEVKDPRRIVEEIRFECEKICPSVANTTSKNKKPRKPRKISPKKRGQNRQASSKYRQRKKHEKISLGDEIKLLEEKNARLKILIADLTSQITYFRGKL
uniref:BZIP domain-containing protein n=1 Tax=Romanomermis culicivorax TaxID=13658 RepID=A0A915K486_ROMCU